MPAPPALPDSLRRRLALASHRGDREDLLRILLEGARRLTGAERAALVRPRDHPGGTFLIEAPAEEPPEIATTPVRRCLESGDTVVAAGTALLQGGPQASARRLGLHWVASLPLPGHGMALYLDSRGPLTVSLGPVEELLAHAAPALADDPGSAGLRPGSANLQANSAGLRPASAGLHPAFATFLGASPVLAEVLQVLDRVAPTRLPVLLLGETGTGKELAARALHQASRRRGRLVAENCAALPAGLVESELFGSARGAFTGAERDRAGLLRAAHRGTLFLDEVGDMPRPVQAKLLRVLQEGEVRPLGHAQPFTVDLRVISATSRPPGETGLRADLLFRLAAVTARLPSLRERREDVPLLARHFLRQVDGPRRRFTAESLDLLAEAPWPGNVRQLRFEVERAAALTPGDIIGPEVLSAEVLPGRDHRQSDSPTDERRMIEAALRRAAGHKTRTARAIGWTSDGTKKMPIQGECVSIWGQSEGWRAAA